MEGILRDPTILKIRASDVHLVRILSSGTQGAVYEAEWRQRRVAAKRLRIDPHLLSAEEREEFHFEIKLLSRLRHQHITSFYGIVLPDVMEILRRRGGGGGDRVKNKKKGVEERSEVKRIKKEGNNPLKDHRSIVA